MQSYEPTSREQVRQLLEDTLSAGTKTGKTKKKRTVKQRIASLFSLLVIVALLGTLASLLYTRMSGGYANLFGYRIFIVETGSMIPTLPIGTLIVVHHPEDPAKLNVNDVITYKHETAVVTHRIIDVQVETNEETGASETVYTTKGDNPDNGIDPWTVHPSDVLGVMIWHVTF